MWATIGVLEFKVIFMLRSRAASHYGWRSRGQRFPPLRSQEIKKLASQPFIVRPKSKGRCDQSAYFFTKAKDSRREFGLDGNGNPNYGVHEAQTSPMTYLHRYVQLSRLFTYALYIGSNPNHKNFQTLDNRQNNYSYMECFQYILRTDYCYLEKLSSRFEEQL